MHFRAQMTVLLDEPLRCEGPDEAAEAVRAFHPKIVYPYHYRGSDLSVFQKALAGSGVEVRILDWYYKS